MNDALKLIGMTVVKKIDSDTQDHQKPTYISGKVVAFENKNWLVQYEGRSIMEYVSFLDLVSMLAQDPSNIRSDEFIEILNSAKLEKLCCNKEE